jgi:hypothetical protein
VQNRNIQFRAAASKVHNETRDFAAAKVSGQKPKRSQLP